MGDFGDNPGCQTVGAVFESLALHPIDHLIRRWNWKSALLSSLLRGMLFFSTNLAAGWHRALGALLAEFVFRSATAGFYGSITEAFRKARPAWAATATTMVLLPVVSLAIISAAGLNLLGCVGLGRPRLQPRLRSRTLACIARRGLLRVLRFSSGIRLWALGHQEAPGEQGGADHQ